MNNIFYKLEYILNAIHYCLWLGFCKLGDNMGNVVEALLSPIPEFLFTKKHQKDYYERLPNEQKKARVFFHSKIFKL